MRKGPAAFALALCWLLAGACPEWDAKFADSLRAAARLPIPAPLSTASGLPPVAWDSCFIREQFHIFCSCGCPEKDTLFYLVGILKSARALFK